MLIEMFGIITKYNCTYSLQHRHFLPVYECFCSQKCHVDTPKERSKWGESKGAGEGAGREKRKRLPENVVK